MSPLAPPSLSGERRLASLALRIALTTLSVLIVVTYPVLVYLGMSHLSTRALGFLLLALVLPALLLRLRGQKREHLKAVLPLPLGVIALLLLSAIIEDHRFNRCRSDLMSVVLLCGILRSVGVRIPLIERFARLQTDDLSAEEVRYCRMVTITWCAFFTLNALLTLALALFAPLAWWAFHTSLTSYLAMGTLFAAEYVLRKYRFRRYSGGWHDRVFDKLFPPRAE